VLKISATVLQRIKKIRHQLHQNPELSGREVETAKFIAKYLRELKLNVIENVGGNSLLTIIESGKAGKTILLRADFDALPIQEESLLPYCSRQQNVAHLCGHDGHTAILLGVAEMLSIQPLSSGKVILLFQAEEETGTGAEKVLLHPDFQKLQPEFTFALHNLPGFPLGSIIIKDEHFASASIGLIAKLLGKTSHAAHPERAISPAKALANLMLDFQNITQRNKFNFFSMLTVIHARLGEIAFGTTPGYAEIMATLRAYDNEDLQKMKEICQQLIKETCEKENLRYEISWAEEFIATVNDKKASEDVRKAASSLNYEMIELNEAFRWSEDFGYFTNEFKGALFGIGSGANHPQLHNPDYDFPDELLEIGVNMFLEILESIGNG
jgi:amidohydrolase